MGSYWLIANCTRNHGITSKNWEMNTVYLFSIAGAKLLLNKSLLSRMQISNRETPPREIMHIHYVGVLLLAAFNGVLILTLLLAQYEQFTGWKLIYLCNKMQLHLNTFLRENILHANCG